jgi:hypothetical protein
LSCSANRALSHPALRYQRFQLRSRHRLQIVERRGQLVLDSLGRLPVCLVDPRDERLRRRKNTLRTSIQETLDRPRHLLRLRNQHFGYDRTGSELLES